MKTRTQIVMIMMEKGIFPLWTFIIPEGIIEERSERRIILKVRKDKKKRRGNELVHNATEWWGHCKKKV
jgi:hypothetical protein